jgi:16S rRNA (guanine527-N7)-methyltransferase
MKSPGPERPEAGPVPDQPLPQSTAAAGVPEAAVVLFGARFGVALRYASHLGTTGVERGLLGPHEVPRIWHRHILNCAVVAELLPPGREVIDVGSGAGLPGIVLAILRPDLRVTLVEPLLRRSDWLSGVVSDLGLENVTVIRDRAESLRGRLRGDVVTARAVAPLVRLAEWCVPLAKPGGEVLAIKGESAGSELVAARGELERQGVTDAVAVQVGSGVVEPATTVVRLRVGDAVASLRTAGRRRSR